MSEENSISDLIETSDLLQLDETNLAAIPWESRPAGLYLTMLLPMEKSGRETRKNHIVFKNALSEACELLQEESPDDELLLKQLSRLNELDDPTHSYWQYQSSGLAVFLSPHHSPRAYRLPFAPDTAVRKGKAPYLGGLLPLANLARYYVLVLDLNETRLFEASRYSVRQIPLEHVPTSLEEAMRFDDPEKSLQFHTVSAPGGPGAAKGDATYHGHGVTTDANERKKIDRFFEKLSGGLADHFPNRETPLLLFGPASETGHYRLANHYPHLLDESIDFNPSSLNDDELEEKIREWIESDRRRASEEDARKLGEALGRGLGSSDPAEIVKLSITGKIDTLYLHRGETVRGHLDRESLKVELDADKESDGTDLSEIAAMETLRNGGKVYCVSDVSPPVEESGMAAIYRY